MIYLTVALRVIFVFASLWAIARLVGKKLMSQLTLFEYITGITIGSLAGSAVMPGAEMGPIAFAMALWGALSYGIHLVNLKTRKAQRFLDGHPTVLVHNGKVLEENLRRSELTVAEMMPRSQARPVSPSELKISTTCEGLPTQIMHEGRPIRKAVQGLGLPDGCANSWRSRAPARRRCSPPGHEHKAPVR